MADERIKEIHEDVKEIKNELKEFTKLTITNQNDIKWIRGGLKIALGAILSIVSAMFIYFFKS